MGCRRPAGHRLAAHALPALQRQATFLGRAGRLHSACGAAGADRHRHCCHCTMERIAPLVGSVLELNPPKLGAPSHAHTSHFAPTKTMAATDHHHRGRPQCGRRCAGPAVTTRNGIACLVLCRCGRGRTCHRASNPSSTQLGSTPVDCQATRRAVGHRLGARPI